MKDIYQKGIIKILCRCWLTTSLRDVYYSDVNLFKKQKKTDAILENLAAMFGVHRNDLNIVS